MSSGYDGQTVFASTFTYAYTKLRGRNWVIEALNRGEGFPGAETFAELKTATEGKIVLFECGNTLITQARSIAAGELLKTDADVWLTFDDDNFAPRATLHALIETARATRGLVGLTCISRAGKTPNHRIEGTWDVGKVESHAGERLYPVVAIGFGVAAIHRSVIEILSAHPGAWVSSLNDAAFPALFLERLWQGHWVGEDNAFCMLMHENFLPRYTLLNHGGSHAGQGCRLNEDGSIDSDAITAERLAAEAKA
jgi:hypothetical protein